MCGFAGWWDWAGGSCRRKLIIYAERMICIADDALWGFAGVIRCGLAMLSLVVWALKREVRAFGGCLGMHRR